MTDVAAELGVDPRRIVRAAASCTKSALEFRDCYDPLAEQAIDRIIAWTDREADVRDACEASEVAAAAAPLADKRMGHCAATMVGRLGKLLVAAEQVLAGSAPQSRVTDRVRRLFSRICRPLKSERHAPPEGDDGDAPDSLLVLRIRTICDAVPYEALATKSIDSAARTLGALARSIAPGAVSPSSLAGPALEVVDVVQELARGASVRAFYHGVALDRRCPPALAMDRARALAAAGEVAAIADRCYMLRDALLDGLFAPPGTLPAPVLRAAAMEAAVGGLDAADALRFGSVETSSFAHVLERECAVLVRQALPFELLLDALLRTTRSTGNERDSALVERLLRLPRKFAVSS